MAVALRLMDEFEGHSLTVLRVVAEAADAHAGCDPGMVETAARARLIAFLGEASDSLAHQDEHGAEWDVPLPRQRAVG
jgi:hypothetical protein